MPANRDELGGGAIGVRRRFLRPLSSWQLEIPGRQELLDPILGLLQYVQGDTPIWFDGAGFGEETSPIIFAIGDGATTDYRLPHRYILISSLVIYINGTVSTAWSPLGGDSLTACDAIRFDAALGADFEATAKYRRKIKCRVRVEDKVTRQRIFRAALTNADNIHNLTVTLEEMAN